MRQGFSIAEANAAYELVSQCALGAAVATIREREAADAGRGRGRGVPRRRSRQRGADELPYLRSLMRESRSGVRRPFAEQVATVLIGVAIGRGEDWQDIQAKLAR